MVAFNWLIPELVIQCSFIIVVLVCCASEVTEEVMGLATEANHPI